MRPERPDVPGRAVVKLGGSLFGSPDFTSLVRATSRFSATLVAGGGAFADAVRDEQKRLRFSDVMAHRMAILAMDQSATCLVDLAPDFALCASVADFTEAAENGRPAVWLPSPMALAADLPASWDVTSDSLALWLAIRLRAPKLVIVKAAAVATQTLEDLADADVIDPYVPGLSRSYRGKITVLGQATADALEAALASPLRRAA